jgi:glutaredoxin-like YruB-family protein
MQVTIYSTPTCPYCKQAKEFMREHNVAFKDVDVASDSKAAQEMIEKTGQMGVPVIEVGSELIVGFDKKRLAKALGVKG